VVGAGDLDFFNRALQLLARRGDPGYGIPYNFENETGSVRT
jgi:hypothetical protein